MFLVPRNLLPHFRFNPNSNVGKERSLDMPILKMWKLRLRNTQFLRGGGRIQTQILESQAHIRHSAISFFNWDVLQLK